MINFKRKKNNNKTTKKKKTTTKKKKQKKQTKKTRKSNAETICKKVLKGLVALDRFYAIFTNDTIFATPAH